MRHLFLCLFIFLPVILLSQNNLSGSISGIVKDADNGEILMNANVYLDHKNLGTITNESGEFMLDQIPFGNYTLKVKYLGYIDHKQHVNLNSTKNEFVEIALVNASFAKDEIIVSENRLKENLNKSIRINVISVDNIQSSAGQNIQEILEFVPGVNVNNQMGIYSSSAVVSLRGMSGNDQSRTLVVLDGVPLNKSDGGSVNWNRIDKDKIDYITINKGPGLAKYGSNAMGGIIEIFTKKPVKPISGNLKFEYGSYNTFNNALSVNGILPENKRNNRFYWGIDGSLKKSDGYITEPIEFQELADSILVPVFLKEYKIGTKAGWYLANNHNIEFHFDLFDDIRGNGIKVFDSYGAYSEHDTYSGLFRYNIDKSNYSLSSDLFYQFELYDRVYEYMNEGEYTLYFVDASRIDRGVNFEYTLKSLNQQEISTGLNFKRGSVDATDTYLTSTDSIINAGKIDMASVYLQDELSFFDEKLQIIAGVRFDLAKFYDGKFLVPLTSYFYTYLDDFNTFNYSTKNWYAISPKFSMQYHFTEGNRMYIAIGRGFRAPVLDDLCRTGRKGGNFNIANPELIPEILDNIEMGYDFRFFDRINFSNSLYYSVGKDFMYSVSTGDSVNYGFRIVPVNAMRNISKVEIYGAEFELNYHIANGLTSYISYTYNHSQIKDYIVSDPDVDPDLNGKYLTDIPNHKWSCGINWKNKFLNSNIAMKHIGEQWMNDQNIIDDEYLFTDKYPSYTIFNLKIEKEIFNQFSFALSIENLFNTYFINNRLQRNPGRFFMLSMRYNFDNEIFRKKYFNE